MEAQVPAPELAGRLERIRARLDQDDPCWEMAAVFGPVNRYYLAGTLQDGVLVVPRDGEATLWVRRSHERACRESLFPDIRPMRSFREVAAGLPAVPRTVHLETDIVPIGLFERFRKHVPVSSVRPLDQTIARVRAIKTPYELACLERAGMVHRRVLEERVPALLREGCSEADFGAAVYAALVEEGHDGLVRFGAPGDFAQAYVIAHEVGHHVQTQLGTLQYVSNAQRRAPNEAEANRLSVALELQADCYAGIWANRSSAYNLVLEPGDIEEGMNAASAVGDDRLQKQSQGYVVPDSFTHGTSAQRVQSFRKGLDTGDLRAGNIPGLPTIG
ncbi:MAG: neutral zinc metallopeptidase [Methanoregulaceae archaeon]